MNGFRTEATAPTPSELLPGALARIEQLEALLAKLGVVFCPACHEPVEQMIEHSAAHTEPHGEYVREEWLECPVCHAKTDMQEIERIRVRMAA